MSTLAQLIEEEIRKADILKDCKEILIKSITNQIKKHGEARIRWGYEFKHDKDLECSDYCITLLDKGERELPLKKWLSEQGLVYRTEYYGGINAGSIWGLSVTLPIR